MRHLKPWLVELIWFAATAILVVLVLLPIRQQIYGFPFERANILFIIGFVTLIRWFLFLSSTPFNRTHWVKIILGMGSIWLGIYALRQFSFFQTFIDEKGIESKSACKVLDLASKSVIFAWFAAFKVAKSCIEASCFSRFSL